MISLESLEEKSVGRYLASVREAAKMSQAQLAAKVPFSPATVSRIESGEKAPTPEEVSVILETINTPMARELTEYCRQAWDEIQRPSFTHPNRAALWEMNITLRKLAALRDDPNLRGVFVRQIDLYDHQLRRIAEFLGACDHSIAWIGSIGVGKSTAISRLTELWRSDEERLERKSVLEVGAGGSTLCDSYIIQGPAYGVQGPAYGVRIVPRSEEAIRKDVEDFCDDLFKNLGPESPDIETADDEDGDTLGISKEVVRVIRNMAGLTETRRDENGRRVRHDPAKALVQQYRTQQELAVHILTRMNLLRRNRRDAWYPADYPQQPLQWVQQTFSAVNNGRHPGFTIPQKIEIVVPQPVLNSQDLSLSIIDTKGIDQTAERPDLECHIDNPRALVVLCSSFLSAPEVAIQTLLHRAKEMGISDIPRRVVILVLSRPDNALAEKYDDGTSVEDEQEGYELKREKISLILRQKGLAHLDVAFFNAKEEAPEALRAFLVAKVVKLRNDYEAEIHRLSQAVDQLDKNRESEHVRLIFERVSSDLSTWIDNHKTIEISAKGVQTPLVDAIKSARYASTVRATIRRHGNWPNLDYYHHLGYGVRRLAVVQIGHTVNAFKEIVNNLINNEDLSPAKEFLQRVLASVDAAVEDTYRRLQVAGREVFTQTLEQDSQFWDGCRAIQGQGYIAAISERTHQRFEPPYDQACNRVLNLIAKEWHNISALLERILRETETATVHRVGLSPDVLVKHAV